MGHSMGTAAAAPRKPTQNVASLAPVRVNAVDGVVAKKDTPKGAPVVHGLRLVSRRALTGGAALAVVEEQRVVSLRDHLQRKARVSDSTQRSAEQDGVHLNA